MQHADELVEADAGNQLHTEQSLIEIGIDLLGEDLDDVLMLEPGHGAAFAAAVGRDLKRYKSIERNLAGEVHVSERAAAEQADDFEVIDLRTGQQGHGNIVAARSLIIRPQGDCGRLSGGRIGRRLRSSKGGSPSSL